MSKKIFFALIYLSSGLLISGCAGNPKSKEESNTKKQETISENIVTDKRETIKLEKETYSIDVEKQVNVDDATGTKDYLRDIEAEGNLLYLLDTESNLYSYNWEQKELQILYQNESDKVISGFARGINDKIYFTIATTTDAEKMSQWSVCQIEDGKVLELATIDGSYEVVTVDDELLYVKKKDDININQINIDSQMEVDNVENKAIDNLQTFMEQYQSDDYTIIDIVNENNSWYVVLQNWLDESYELYVINGQGTITKLYETEMMSFLGVQQGQAYVLDGQEDTKIYTLDANGDKEVYFDFSLLENLEEYSVTKGCKMQDGFATMFYGGLSDINIFIEKDNKMICLKRKK